MKKKIFITFAIACVMALSLALAGCSSSSSSSSSSSDVKELEVVESGYQISDYGYVYYAVKVHNKSQTYANQYPTVTVTGKDASGSIVFSNEWCLGTINPDETSYWATQAGNGSVTSDTQIEITVTANSKNWVKADKVDGDIYTTSNVSVVKSSIPNYKTITGEVTLNKEGEKYVSPMIVCILRDADGKIVGGYSTYLFSDLTVGTPKAFETIGYEFPEYATVEVYANPWP